MKKFFDSKAFKIVKTVLRVMIWFCLFAFVISVCLQSFSNNKLSFFNYRMFTVITGSMKPKYDIGDVLIDKKIKAEDIKVGDAITYQGLSNSYKDKVITHQVVKIEKKDGKYYYHTKGLANLVEDPLVSYDQVLGKVIYKSILISFVYKIISTNVGFYAFIIVPIMYIIISEIISTLLEREEKRRNG